ncbi:hypothetical protein DV738_g3516, partial [Chaetothyriales sp. CBS 135597]
MSGINAPEREPPVRRLPVEEQTWDQHPKNKPYSFHRDHNSADPEANMSEPYEAFTLGPGEKKIEEKIDNRTPSTSTFTLNKEDHTLGNLLRDKLLQHPHVTFAAYKIPHPLFATVELRVQTDGVVSPKQALQAACSDLIGEIHTFKTRFKQAYELTKMSKAPADLRSRAAATAAVYRQQLQQPLQQLQQPQQQSLYVQPQQTGFPLQQQQSLPPAPAPPSAAPTSAPATLRPQQTSAQIAQSFASTPSAPVEKASASGSARIPNIRLSFITASDQARFEQLFKSAAGTDQALSGEKARDLLLRSQLPGSALSQIWVLSDTTKSGQLLFPEFALAMYLCNLKLTGKDLPAVLPDRVKNEVSSMVDIISFGVPDDRVPALPRTNVPDFDAPLRQNTISPPAPQAPRPQQASNQQLLSQLTSQPTGFYNQAMGIQSGLQPQATGFPAQQPAGFQNQPAATGYTGPRPPLPPMPTGFGQAPSASPLQAMPTGLPGQWGYVNAPASGLPNIDALKQRLMPQAGREGGFTTAGLAGTAQVPWAVTKDEKRIYDELFKAWDGFNKGVIAGHVAIELMGQSGLERKDLEAIWTLSDPNNKGALNMDEFAVAMHLIYRKLNGYPVPARLPPELIPPSTRNFNSSIDKVKGLLSQEADARKQSGAFLQPQKTGVSYLKEHTFRGSSSSPSFGRRKDATLFRNNDSEVGYRSSARRRLGGDGRTPSPVSSEASSAVDDLAPDQIRKKIREAKVLLDATDFNDEKQADEDDVLDRRDKHEAQDLFRQIRQLQDDIDTHPNATLASSDSGAERRAMRRELQKHQDRLPEVASKVRKIEKDIAEARLQLFRLKDAKANPGGALSIIGTGPGGAVTEADRIKARARARMQARAAELAGRPAPVTDDEGAAQRRLHEETTKVRSEQERHEAMTRDVEDSVKDFVSSLEDGLREVVGNETQEHERRRWEEGLGVEDEVKELIYDLQRQSRTARVRKEDRGRSAAQPAAASYRDEPKASNGDPPSRSTSQPSQQATSPSPANLSQADRVASAKEKALRRIQERMAAAGLKPATSDSNETAQQRAERENKEREERIRKAEAEDARREQERQARLANEGVTPAPLPPSPKSTKKPAPPPTRKTRQESSDWSTSDRNAREVGAKSKAEDESVREADGQKGTEAPSASEESQFAREQAEQAARLKALEEQVRLTKIKKAEEKARKKAAEKEAKAKEEQFNKQRAEIEAARQRERELQLQLEAINNDDSSSDDDDDGPEQITPQTSTPVPRQTLSSATPADSSHDATAQSPPSAEKSRNPYFKKLSQSSESTSEPMLAASADLHSTNPFHRMAQQEAPKAAVPAFTGTAAQSRRRPEEDEWSAADSDNDDDDSDEGTDTPGAGSAKHLASILFGTMAPPRPLSAAGRDSKPATPVPQTPVAAAPSAPDSVPPPPPPPAPPLPGA